MKKNIKNSILFVSAFLIISCAAGTKFTKLDNSTVNYGITTYQDIISKFGKPYQQGEITKNGEKLKTITYAYAHSGAKSLETNVVASRAQSFSFHKDKLISTEYISSFAEDHTDIDLKNISQLEKGKSTKDDVIKIFGAPGGYSIYPAISDKEGLSMNYAISKTIQKGLSFKVHTKMLNITLNKQNIVTNIESSEN